MRYRQYDTDKTGVTCSNCGPNKGTETNNGNHRCNDCGQFAQENLDYCVKHGIDVGRLTGYDECPRCRQERDVRMQEQEMQARRANPRMHSQIDAHRY